MQMTILAGEKLWTAGRPASYSYKNPCISRIKQNIKLNMEWFHFEQNVIHGLCVVSNSWPAQSWSDWRTEGKDQEAATDSLTE